jgi:hypothetical protein
LTRELEVNLRNIHEQGQHEDDYDLNKFWNKHATTKKYFAEDPESYQLGAEPLRRKPTT